MDRVTRSMFRRPLIADTGFDQDLFSARVDKDAIHVHANAVFVVGRAHLRPQLTRNNTEHGASVEAKFSILNHLDGVISYSHLPKYCFRDVATVSSAPV